MLRQYVFWGYFIIVSVHLFYFDLLIELKEDKEELMSMKLTT